MALIDWNDTLSVNVKIIDEQHRVLVRYINELYDYIHEHKGYEGMDTIFSRLIEFAKSHFETEETFFEKFNYENSESHKRRHKMFFLKMEEFHHRYIGNDEMVRIDLLKYLKDWFLEHLRTEDRLYVKCFHEHGLE